MELKYGQEITITKDINGTTLFGDEPYCIKRGTKGYVNSSKMLHITTGEHSGNEIRLSDEYRVSGHDIENISRLVVAGILYSCSPIRDILEDYEISEESITEVVMEVLEEVLEQKSRFMKGCVKHRFFKCKGCWCLHKGMCIAIDQKRESGGVV